jgi:hypothetical protein
MSITKATNYVKSPSVTTQAEPHLNGASPSTLPDILSLVSASTVAPADTKPVPHFKPLSLSELLKMPAKLWLIDQLIGSGDIGMVYGAPGSAKTFVTVDLIFAACLGQQFAGRFDVARPLNVAYCASEGVSGLPARFAAAAAHYGVEAMPTFTFFDVVPSLYCESQATAQAESIQNFIIEWQQRQAAGHAQPLDVLFIDTLHGATAGADENSAQDMGKVLALCKLATKLLGCAVVLVHHTNKAGTGERGSSAMRGAMDVMLECRAVAGKFVMSCEKLKDGEKWKDQTFDLVAMGESVRVWWDEPGDGSQSQGNDSESRATILAFMRSQPGTKLAAKVLAEVAGIYQVKAVRLLSKMVGEGACKSALMYADKPNSNRNPLAYFVE